MLGYSKKILAEIQSMAASFGASFSSIITSIGLLITTAIAWRTTTIQEDLFIQGKAFSYEDYHVFSDGEVKYFIFSPLDCNCDQLVFSPLTFASTSGPILIEYYFGMTSEENGEKLQASNRRATSTNLPKSTLRLAPTISDIGTRISGDLVPSTGIAAPNFKGAESPTGLPFEVTLTDKWGMKVTNLDGDGVYFGMKMTWFEI